MHLIKLLIGLALLGYGSFLLFQRFSVDLQPVPAVVTQSYEDSFRGQNYVSDRYAFGGRDTGEAVCKYKVGDELVAYVDPEAPARAVINRNISGFVYGLTSLGLLMLIQTISGYWVDKHKSDAPKLLQKANHFLGPLIGMTVLLGGIGYFIYVLVLAATNQCVN